MPKIKKQVKDVKKQLKKKTTKPIVMVPPKKSTKSKEKQPKKNPYKCNICTEPLVPINTFYCVACVPKKAPANKFRYCGKCCLKLCEYCSCSCCSVNNHIGSFFLPDCSRCRAKIRVDHNRIRQFLKYNKIDILTYAINVMGIHNQDTPTMVDHLAINQQDEDEDEDEVETQ